MKEKLERFLHWVWCLHCTLAITCSVLFIEICVMWLFNPTGVDNIFVHQVAILACINLPITFVFRQIGIDKLNFLKHDDDLDPMHVEKPKLNEMQILIDKIERAQALDRQIARGEARDWMLKNEEKFTDEEIVFAKENFGYMLPNGFGDKSDSK